MKSPNFFSGRILVFETAVQEARQPVSLYTIQQDVQPTVIDAVHDARPQFHRQWFAGPQYRVPNRDPSCRSQGLTR